MTSEIHIVAHRLPDPCGVCLGNLNNGEVVVAHGGGGILHPFHRRCLIDVVDRVGNSCPFCRTPLNKESLFNCFTWAERLKVGAFESLVAAGHLVTNLVSMGWITKTVFNFMEDVKESYKAPTFENFSHEFNRIYLIDSAKNLTLSERLRFADMISKADQAERVGLLQKDNFSDVLKSAMEIVGLSDKDKTTFEGVIKEAEKALPNRSDFDADRNTWVLLGCLAATGGLYHLWNKVLEPRLAAKFQYDRHKLREITLGISVGFAYLQFGSFFLRSKSS